LRGRRPDRHPDPVRRPSTGRGKDSRRPWRHGASLLGDLKYGPDFKRFDYVNPNAPKGGTVRLSGFGGTYDNFNPVVAGVKGTIANGVAEIYDTLLVSPLDEVETSYGCSRKV